MSKRDADRLYQLILHEDESLMGVQWEDVDYSEYNTPKSIIDNMLRIYLLTDFIEWSEDLTKHPLVDNFEDKILAMAKYFEKIAKDLRERVRNPKKVKEYTNTFCGHTAYISECPECGCRLNSHKMQKYCHECGQRLEWEE